VPLTPLYLFAMCVGIWGSTWIAITYQLGSVAPEASVFYRFLLAAGILFAFCRWKGLSLRFGLRQHLALAAQGTFMFSLSYMFVYHAEALVVSGLVAVGFSASPLLNMLGVRLAFGTPISRRVASGALLGIAGIVLVFWPEIGTLSADAGVGRGVLYTSLGVLASAAGSVIASRNGKRGVPVWQGLALGMLYGAACSLIITLAAGKPLGFEWSASYAASLVYLSLFGSVIAFAGYLTLLERIGPARAAYIGVMVPIVALVISALFEDYAWRPQTWLGIALSMAGNVVILRRSGVALDAPTDRSV
jgi:drug/metabolite transporter (DMT)-like permease